MIVQAQNKFKLFTDLDGNPLNNGYVYIGTAGANPETNPITVYSDSAFTVPVAQPLRTLGGYTVLNGNPISVYTNADYSITVRNSDGTLVYTSSSGNIDATQESALDALAEVETAKTTAISDIETAGQLEQWEAEAWQKTADSYATEAEDVFVKTYTSNGDGTFTATDTTDYSALHWAAKAIPYTLASGTYTPVATSVTNCTATFNECRYIRVGDMVTVYGSVAISVTSSPVADTRVYFDLPIASNISSSNDVSGNLICSPSGLIGSVLGYAADNEGFLDIKENGTGGNYTTFSFGYMVV